jgi:predicted ATPase
MEGKSLIRSIQLKNFLSYENVDPPFELGALNVLIGPNASGKSNLLEAIALLHAAPKDLAALISEGGGIREWLWKGTYHTPVPFPLAKAALRRQLGLKETEDTPTATIDAVIDYPDGIMPLRYRLTFTAIGQRFGITDESVENERPTMSNGTEVFSFYRYDYGRPVLNYRTTAEAHAGTLDGRAPINLQREELSPERSILSQRKDPGQLPEITYLGTEFSSIKLYREWSLGRYMPARMPQKADGPEDFLLEDASNLGLVLNDLEQQSGTKSQILAFLRKFYDGADDITTKIYANTVQINIHEKGLKHPVPATRLSDGTLRYLSLLAILCHPSPPSLICIEEPELGLHPDIMPTLAELLIDASQRTQLIVTTHSDALVSALGDVPEAIVVCERDNEGTHLKRLKSKDLEKWLQDYALGDLWRMGQIGGNRW